MASSMEDDLYQELILHKRALRQIGVEIFNLRKTAGNNPEKRLKHYNKIDKIIDKFILKE